MKLSSKGNVFSSVKKNKEELIAITCILNEKLDMTTELIVDIDNFRIKQVTWHVYKCDIDSSLEEFYLPTGKGETDILDGEEAYLQAHKSLKKLICIPGGKLLQYALFQSSKAIVQAETFIFDVRGYDSRESYDAYWDQVEADGCMFYTHSEAEDLRWSQYVGNFNRGDYIFERFKSFIDVHHGTKLTKFGIFSDSYHQIEITLTLDKSIGDIEAFRIDYVRVPGSACLKNIANGQRLVGQNISDLNKKNIVTELGGGEGCYHIVDITWDMIYSFQMEQTLLPDR